MPSADPPHTPAPEESPPSAPNAAEGVRWPVRLQGASAQQLDTFLNRAQAQIQMQRWPDARVSLEAALALAPDHPKALELHAQVLARLRRGA